MDHITRKGYVSEFLYGMSQKPIARKNKMTILDATAAVDREWDKLKSLLTWDFKNVKPKSEVVRQAKKDGIPPHAASLMGIANTPSSRKSSLPSPLRPPPSSPPKTKERVVLRRDNVKNDSGHRAVFAEQVASASQVAGANFLETCSRHSGMAGEGQQCSISLHTGGSI